MITYASHNHSVHSLKDCASDPKELVAYFAANGGKVIALTDHGTLTGIFDFMDACEEYGIKGVPGLEAYVAEDGEERLHLILLPKDITGFRAVSDALMDANRRIEKVGTNIYPQMDKKILLKHFGPGSKGHGHVIATSACIGGVVAGLYIRNNKAKQELEKLQNFIGKVTWADDAVKKNNELREELKLKKDAFKVVADKKYTSRLKTLEKLRLKNDPEYEAVKTALEKEMDESKKAAAQVNELTKTMNAVSKKITQLKKDCKEEDLAALKKKVERRDMLQSYVKTDTVLHSYMEAEALRYESIFGKGNFYIELQYHGMPEEKMYFAIADQIAQKHDIPTLAANDAHMISGSKEEIMQRESIRSLMFNRIEKASETDKELYLKSDDDLERSISSVVGPVRARLAMEGTKNALEQCNVVFPKGETHYPVFDPKLDANKLLKDMVMERIPTRFTKEQFTEEYQKRLAYELEVICSMGYADYHLIVQDLINFAKKLGKMPEERYAYLKDHIKEMTLTEITEYVDKDQSYVGYTVGPGRGSSAGSLVCYILGITDLDPIRYDLLFERFLNPERVSMPDIDTDYANGYREVAIEYAYKRYGKESVCRIITMGTDAAKGAIKDIARSLGNTEGNDEMEYDYLGKQLSKIIPGGPGDKIADYMPQLGPMIKDNPRAAEVIKRASLIEGKYKQYGMHAAGVIIADGRPVSEYVPLAFDNESGQWKCQCDMVRAENSGLLKFDFLGLKNLNIITECLRHIYRNYGIRIGPDKDIHEEKEVIRSIIAAGNTNSVFQLESGGLKRVAKDMGPDSFEDIILLVAAYRPGPMESIPDMIAVKKGQKQPSYAAPQLKDILDKTYGTIIYQEQVQQVFQRLAGYSLGRADIVRRAMSKKKEKDLLKEKPLFIEGCAKNGISEEAAVQIFDSMTDFAKYAFNKSHAAVYARITYITAWLKYHYPTEFMAVAMKYASKKAQLIALIAEAKKMGIKIKPININLSTDEFLPKSDKSIYFGISAIDGITNIDPIVEKRKEHPFVSFQDYIYRGHFKRNVTESLIDVGAFDSFNTNRTALHVMYDSLNPLMDTYKKKEKSLKEQELFLSIVTQFENVDDVLLMEQLRQAGYKNKTILTKELLLDRISRIKADMEEIKNEILDAGVPDNAYEDLETRLNKEKELTGIYITGHPLDQYENSGISLEELPEQTGKYVKICGVISDIRELTKKATGEKFAGFTLETKDGELQVMVFTKAYKEVQAKLNENAVVMVNGKVMEETYKKTDENGNEQEEKEYKIFANTISDCKKKRRRIMITVNDLTMWQELFAGGFFDSLKVTGREEELEMLVYDKAFGEIRIADFGVKTDILKEDVYKFLKPVKVN